MRNRFSLYVICLLFAGIFTTLSCAPTAQQAATVAVETEQPQERKEGLEISDVKLDDEGPKVTSRPGETIQGTLNYRLWSRDGCPVCVDQVVVGIGDKAEDCAYDGIPGVHPGRTGTGSFSVTVPSSEGEHELRYKRTKAYTCEQAMGIYDASPPPADNTIGTIVVSSTGRKETKPEAPVAGGISAAALTGETMTVKVYFSNKKFDRTKRCSTVYPVQREAQKSTGVARASLNQLFQGVTEQERAKGYHSPFSEKSANILKDIKIKNNTAYVNLKDFRTILPNTNTPCGGAQFLTFNQLLSIPNFYIINIDSRLYILSYQTAMY